MEMANCLGSGADSVLSLTPLPQLPEVVWSDKIHHLIAYSVLMFPAFLAMHKARFVLLSAFFIWSGVIELIQPFVNRYGELLDLLANGVGLLIGALLALLCRKLIIDLQT